MRKEKELRENYGIHASVRAYWPRRLHRSMIATPTRFTRAFINTVAIIGDSSMYYTLGRIFRGFIIARIL